MIVDTARRHGVPPNLALAVSWQESGWQMHRTSSAHAIGAMQVLPATGAWMSLYADRPLKLEQFFGARVWQFQLPPELEAEQAFVEATRSFAVGDAQPNVVETRSVACHYNLP